MKAVVLRAFGGAENFAVMDWPIPEVGPGEVRIRIKAASFNPIDYQLRKGPPAGAQVRSMILGRDLSGTIDAVDESVSDFARGDDVFSYVCTRASSGTYAQYVSVPAELVARKPESLSYAQAAAVPVAGITASLALDKAALDRSKSIFVAGGAGGVGTFVIQLARHRGVRNIVATAGSAASRAHLVEHCGLHAGQIIDYRHPDFIEQARERNGGPFEAALDLVGGRMLSACCALLGLEGNLVSITEAPSRDDFDTLFDKNASFHPVGANAYSLIEDRALWRKYRATLERLGDLFATGALPAPAIRIVGALSAEVVRGAHTLLETGAVQGKLVMTC